MAAWASAATAASAVSGWPRARHGERHRDHARVQAAEQRRHGCQPRAVEQQHRLPRRAQGQQLRGDGAGLPVQRGIRHLMRFGLAILEEAVSDVLG
jgi:hypothetical protein